MNNPKESTFQDRARLRNKQWKVERVKDDSNPISLGSYPTCPQDIERNWAYLEQLRRIFFPNATERMDKQHVRLIRPPKTK